MKIASRPTTIARTPRPSAKAARMMARPRTWPAASGFRPMAVADRPARMPMPMPGPMTPSAARPAPMCSISRLPPCWLWLSGLTLLLVGGLLRGAAALGRRDDVLRHVALLLGVALDGENDKHQRQHAEDERLDGVEHQLEGDQQDRHDADRERRDHAERDLAAVDVAE